MKITQYFFSHLKKLWCEFEFESTARWIYLSILIGVVAGLGAMLFHWLCQVGFHFLLDGIAGYVPTSPAGEPSLFRSFEVPFRRWLLLFIPALGGLVSGILVFKLAPEAEGHGTDAAIDAYHNKKGIIRPRVPFIKMIASAITIGSGGSGGREGPIALMGAGFGSWLATRLHLSPRERRILLATGLGAGVGAIFRAPLAGALLAAEVLYRSEDLETEVIMPAAIASIIGYSIFATLFGWDPLFHMPHVSFRNPLELLPYSVLALAVAFMAIFYIRTFYATRDWFRALAMPKYLKPALGGLLTGVIGFFLPQTLSVGYGVIQEAIHGELLIPFLLVIAFAKVLTTSFSVGSGGSAGVFGPSMVIGGALGGAIGQIFHGITPALVPHPSAFVLVGMAGFFAGAARTPISTLIMVSELTGNYYLIVPSLWVCTISFLVARRWTLYEKQAPSREESPAHRGDFILDILQGMKVKDVYPADRQVRIVHANTHLRDILPIVFETTQRYFPVLNEREELCGIFSMTDIRGVLQDQGHEVSDLILACDILNPRVITITLEDDLSSVMRKFTIGNFDELPIVDRKDPKHFIGMLMRRHALVAYNKKLLEKEGEFAE